MPATHFDPPLFIQDLQSTPVALDQTPFFFNHGGTPCYLAEMPVGGQLLEPQPNDPQLRAGYPYTVRGIRDSSTSDVGRTREFDIAGSSLAYEPLWLTPERAAAFGMTAVGPGQGLRIQSPTPMLEHMHYAYGVFAGHWSPYQDTGNRLLSITCTDLEHHAFPHIFASTDPHQPLVISVARYWPGEGIIRLADLWIPRNWCVYLPPQEDAETAACMNLHNNRNSARACWGLLQQDHIQTQTLLRADGYFHWYWNALPTHHTSPDAPKPETCHGTQPPSSQQ